MQTFLGILLGSVTVLGFWFYKRYQQKKKIRQRFKNNWGKPKNRSYNWATIRCYHDYQKKMSSNYHIDNETWDDLNLDQIYSEIDHTVSPVGQQVLFDILRSPEFNEKELEKRKQFIELFQNESFRIKL